MMPKPPLLRTEIFTRSEHIFFDDLVAMMTSLTSFGFAAQLIKTKHSPILLTNDDAELGKMLEMPFAGAHVNELYAYRSYEPLLAISNNERVNEVVFNVHQFAQRPTPTSETHYVSYPAQLNHLIVGSAFANFYENQLSHIEQKFTKTRTNWPAELNFARVIRNAYSHGGQIHFDNPTAAAVSWKGLTYSPADNGKFIHSDIYLVEVVQLMQLIAAHLA